MAVAGEHLSFSRCVSRPTRRPCRSRSLFRKTSCSGKRTYQPANRLLSARGRTTNLGPFGEVIRATGPMAKLNPFRFSTKYQDDESDLLYYGFRYLNTSTGRWLNTDPIGERGGLNLYGFVKNGPVSHVDWLGLLKPASWCPFCKCDSVTITYSPVQPPSVGFYANGTRFGDTITVKWLVYGDPQKCKYGQDESGLFIAIGKSGQKGKSSHFTNHPDLATDPAMANGLSYGLHYATYTDYMGIEFNSPADDGNWTYAVNMKIHFYCTSSDGTKTDGGTTQFGSDEATGDISTPPK